MAAKIKFKFERDRQKIDKIRSEVPHIVCYAPLSLRSYPLGNYI